MRYGNCWIFAIPKFIIEGGYLIVRWSPRNALIPHIAWSRDLETVEDFVPEKPKRTLIGMIHAFCFKGRQRKYPLEKFKNE